ncbi:hypothetical protein HHL11_31790 [Ramlibacter sp. G-1-2-2]|uniref:Uncharacterized protein n=1 Tax=Ramlibacter agri TaxID=2728837 RepID=A0A848HDX4_9BURK|nr:hypothetical protein [Ramlibacter agri]NML48372.1 hypothetical protein [Ramlibacter agri]
MALTNHPASLQAELRARDARAATLSYTVHNQGGTELFLFNRMYAAVDASGRHVLDRDLCNIEADDAGIVISKKIPALRASQAAALRNLPCVTVVAPGASFIETLTLALPLLPWTPHAEPPARQNPQLLPVVFELGFTGVAGTRAQARPVRTTLGEALRLPDFGIEGQLLVRSPRLGNLPVFRG